MAQRQFRSDDTDKWLYGYGSGVDGAYSSAGNATDAPIDSSCSGTTTQTSLSATNASFATGQLILIHQSRGTGVGAWELNRIASYTAGTITLSHALMNTYTDSGASQAQVLVLKQYSAFTQNSGHTLTAKAWDGNVGGIIAFLCSGTTTITGSITAVGKGYLGGASRNNVFGGAASQGEGTSGAGVQDNVANGNGGGGGRNTGANKGYGGGGGNGVAGTNGGAYQGTGGTGGSAVGAASLITMDLGGGGGGGITDNGSTPVVNGGNGGGIIFIVSSTLTITGSVLTGGAAHATSGDAKPGGGAGGSALLKVKNATLGTSLLTSPGGTTDGGGGGAGGVGRIHIDYKTSYTGMTSPSIDAIQDLTLDYIPTGGSFLYNLC